jgi:hypothetical protein
MQFIRPSFKAGADAPEMVEETPGAFGANPQKSLQ